MTVCTTEILDKMIVPEHVKDVLRAAKSYQFIGNRAGLLDVALGNPQNKTFDVGYDVNGNYVKEVQVNRCKNGFAVNYLEEYMRRRDPECMLIGDDKPTDKVTFKERQGKEFGGVREETFEWLKQQDLIVTAFTVGAFEDDEGYGGLLVAPANAGFFVAGLADLQGILDIFKLDHDFKVHTTLYLAPPFRHTHFDGKQVVVHNRCDDLYEIFSYNLYPGPSAKKGVYGVLLSIGEKEEWTTLHASTVQVVTPYDNVSTIMHEGASGSGKSEMLEHVHREEDGRLLLGENCVNSNERKYLTLPHGCVLNPVTDDMAMCHTSAQNDSKQVVACDAEQAWFVRLNHLLHYGTDPHLEKVTIHPEEPLIFLNLEGAPDSTILVWDHIQDKPGVPCPNPRVILPRHLVPGTVNGMVEVQLRNFGIRTPPCTKEMPTYGIVGYLHFLSPALAWLWRLVAPRGHANPSITESEALTSEGVGSYWPFASGRFVDHANLLLRQIIETPETRYSLTPNQHVGAWKVSFMPQWISREYLSRRGMARFKADQLVESRCSLLGHTLKSMQVEGSPIPHELLRVEEQPEVGIEGYDKGAEILHGFFRKELEKFRDDGLDSIGRKIIECCMDNGSDEDYEKLINS
ncbi:DUF4914 family protein [Chitinispirillales bacterium ANBcel5]|uniref:DUF4914 family protein n=1 Tax=Cellulosispirillum alkaliphilum TaxID=3039283 RepID=UPI002A560028|nr:DUF4914 family protein [Chitinispirillales bacterium ANBcel5]